MVSIRAGSGGGLGGDLESIDQSAGQKIPLANVAASASRLTFSVPSIGATYEGDWNESTRTWSGFFRQGAAVPLTLTRGQPSAAPVVDGLDGTWRGTLVRGTVNLRHVLRVRTGGFGTRVRLDSPDAGAVGLEVDALVREGDSVRFRVPPAEVTFAGSLAAGRILVGAWTRPGRTTPISCPLLEKPQLDALAYLFVRQHEQGITVASIFWGLWLFPFGMLVIRSGFIPRVFGVLLMMAGR
ncbi:MAG: DUF4386 domain-containing protein [Gemmatimonadales bacterium]